MTAIDKQDLIELMTAIDKQALIELMTVYVNMP